MDDVSVRAPPGAPDFSNTQGGKKMQSLLDEWKATVEKLDELQIWLVKAAEEIKNAKPNDPRRKVYQEIEAAAERLDKELSEIEQRQEDALTRHLETTGPLTLALDGGVHRVLAATERTAGGTADLLPRDLLAAWRVAAVFGGSVVTADGPTRLTFGDAAQIAATRTKKARKR